MIVVMVMMGMIVDIEFKCDGGEAYLKKKKINIFFIIFLKYILVLGLGLGLGLERG